MPVHEVEGGYRWGNHGKVYASREDAVRQGAAAHAAGYSEKGDAFGPAAFSETVNGSGGAPPREKDPTYPDEPTAESEDWRTQGDGRILASATPDYERALATLRTRLAKRSVLEVIHRRFDRLLKGEGATYKLDFAGVPLVIDRPKGFVQEGKRPDGSTWQRVYQYDYGFFPETEGGDGEGIDVYIGPDAEAEHTYWIAQHTFGTPPAFDEWKVFLGFPSAARAELAFRLHGPAEIMGSTYAVPFAVVRSLLGHDPRGALGAEKLLGAMRKVGSPDMRESGRLGAPFPAPDQWNDTAPGSPEAPPGPEGTIAAMRARLAAMNAGYAAEAGLVRAADIAGGDFEGEVAKAGEGGDAAAESVGEHAREAAERIGELGEGGHKKPEGHGGKKPKGHAAHGEKKPAAHAGHGGGGGEKKPEHEGGKGKGKAKPKGGGGGDGRSRDDHGRFASKAAKAFAALRAVAPR